MAKKLDSNIEKIVSVLKSEFNPRRLFLFGSRANDTANNNSDYDFVVVVKDAKGDRSENMSRARALIHEKVGVSADVFVYDEQEFNDWQNELSSIPETALNTGRELDLG